MSCDDCDPDRQSRKFLWAALVVLGCGILAVAIIVLAVKAEAHPGRLDKSGCHHVEKPYVYHDGRRVEAGTFHCHKPLDRMKLDGRDVLDETPEEAAKGNPVRPELLIESRP